MGRPAGPVCRTLGGSQRAGSCGVGVRGQRGNRGVCVMLGENSCVCVCVCVCVCEMLGENSCVCMSERDV